MEFNSSVENSYSEIIHHYKNGIEKRCGKNQIANAFKRQNVEFAVSRNRGFPQ